MPPRPASADPLIRDQFAEPLVSTPELEGVREQVAAWWAGAEDDDEAEDEDFSVRSQNMIDSQAVRTHFFDAYFAAAAQAGIRQIVLLAAGLDSRAYRLDWPAGTIVYEIDLPKVLEYKTETLAGHGATPIAERRPVPVDLRHDWPQALRDNGFDASQPTAWLAEGLLPFLPAAAQEALFVAIDALSASGSQVSVENFGIDPDRRREAEARFAELRAKREARGQDTSFNPFDLWFEDGERPDCADWFAAHGWTTGGGRRARRGATAGPGAAAREPTVCGHVCDRNQTLTRQSGHISGETTPCHRSRSAAPAGSSFTAHPTGWLGSRLSPVSVRAHSRGHLREGARREDSDDYRIGCTKDIRVHQRGRGGPTRRYPRDGGPAAPDIRHRAHP